MKLKQEARVLHNKAVASLVTAMTAFNSPVDTGRTTHVLLHLQHAFEMTGVAGPAAWSPRTPHHLPMVRAPQS